MPRVSFLRPPPLCICFCFHVPVLQSTIFSRINTLAYLSVSPPSTAHVPGFGSVEEPWTALGGWRMLSQQKNLHRTHHGTRSVVRLLSIGHRRGLSFAVTEVNQVICGLCRDLGRRVDGRTSSSVRCVVFQVISVPFRPPWQPGPVC